MSQFSEHDPNGQSIKAAGGITHYSRKGWRRWLVPTVILVVVLAFITLALALLLH